MSARTCVCVRVFARAAGSASEVRTRSSRSLAEVVDDGDAGLEWSGVPVAVHAVRPLPAHCLEAGRSGSAGRSLARIGGAVLARRHGSTRVRMMSGGPLCAGMPSRASAGLRPRHRCRRAKSRISARAVGACHRPPAPVARRSIVSVGVGRWNLANGFRPTGVCDRVCAGGHARAHLCAEQAGATTQAAPSLLAAAAALHAAGWPSWLPSDHRCILHAFGTPAARGWSRSVHRARACGTCHVAPERVS